jgi:hypothetical protein
MSECKSSKATRRAAEQALEQWHKGKNNNLSCRADIKKFRRKMRLVAIYQEEPLLTSRYVALGVCIKMSNPVHGQIRGNPASGRGRFTRAFFWFLNSIVKPLQVAI